MTEQKFALDESIEEDIKLLGGAEEEPDDKEEDLVDDKAEEEPAEEEVKEDPVKEPVKDEPDARALAAARFENSELKRRLAESQKPAPVAKVEEKAPDATEDPIGFLAYENKQLREKVESVAKWKEEQDTAKQQQEFYAAQVRGFNTAEDQFKGTVSDYEEVSNHLMTELKTSLKRIYPTATPQQIDAAAANKIIDLAEQAAQRGEQPVGYLYNLSKTVYGYTPKANEDVVEKAKKPDLAVVARNQAKSKNGLGGQGAKSAVTPEAYADMSIAEMEAAGGDFYDTYRA